MDHNNVLLSSSRSYLTEAQAAEYLNISLSTLRRWRRSGAAPEFFRVGSIIRFSREALAAFIERHTRRPE